MNRCSICKEKFNYTLKNDTCPACAMKATIQNKKCTCCEKNIISENAENTLCAACKRSKSFTIKKATEIVGAFCLLVVGVVTIFKSKNS